jgi:dihydrofolate reductase
VAHSTVFAAAPAAPCSPATCGTLDRVGRLIYSAITSIDGYVEDAHGSFEWAAPDEEVHAFVNDQERTVGTYLYGRRMYETMRVWDDTARFPDASPVALDYAELWQGADKIVYSTTLDLVSTRRTRLERSFDPPAVAAMVTGADRDVSIGGPDLAAHAFAAAIIDEVHLFLNPITVGDGKPALPGGLRLELRDQHRFAGGVVHLHYAVR